MSGKKVGYIRVSSFEQNPERQLDGVRLDKQFIDKASGKDTERSQLQAMLDYVREDDTVIVHSMDRLARNLDDLRRLVSQLTAKKVKVEFIKESLVFTDEDSPMSKLLLSVMGAVAEFERALIKERQMEGIELAKKRGAYKGRKPTLSDEQLNEIKQRLAKDGKKSEIARDFNISRETLYQYLKKYTPQHLAIQQILTDK